LTGPICRTGNAGRRRCWATGWHGGDSSVLESGWGEIWEEAFLLENSEFPKGCGLHNLRDR
jgi:hypothetical protein